MSTHPTHTTPLASSLAAFDSLDLIVATTLSGLHPSLGRLYVQGRHDAEHGEVSVATVMWASMAVLMAAALGVIIWTKIRAKGNAIDLDTPAAGVGQ